MTKSLVCSSTLLCKGQRLLSQKMVLKRRQLLTNGLSKQQRITAYHLGSSSGWSLTGVLPRAGTEVTPTASQLRCGALASTANEDHTKQEKLRCMFLWGKSTRRASSWRS